MEELVDPLDEIFEEDDELTAEQLSRMYDGSCDGPDPELVPEEYPEQWGGRGGGFSSLMAAALEAAADPGQASDAELVRLLPAWREVASRAGALELRATAELLRRRKPMRWDHSKGEEPQGPVRAAREVVQEIALALTLTGYGADTQANLADDLSTRLPATFAEMDAGRVDRTRAAIIAEGLGLLDDEAARRADEQIAPQAGAMTTGQLRDKVRRLAISVDPAEADRRRERAERRARTRLYANPDHTATLAAENVPSHLAAAAFARICAIAAALKAAGASSGSDLLRAQVTIGLLLGTLAGSPGPDQDPPDPGPPDPGPPDPGPQDRDPQGPGPQDRDPQKRGPQDRQVPEEDEGRAQGYEGEASIGDDVGEPGHGAPWPPVPGTGDAAAPGCARMPSGLRPAVGRLKLTVAWRTVAGLGPEPGELTWLGPVTRRQATELATAAVGDPNVTWNLIVTDDEGRAIAFAPLPGRSGGGVAARGLVSEVTLTIPASLAARPQATEGITGPLAGLLAAAIPVAARAAEQARDQAAADAAAGGCAHAAQSEAYRVPPRMRGWLVARDKTCRNPICRQPAWRCDLDHTLAHANGGRTCPCGLGSLCRSHHELKQLPGWTLQQLRPGYFTWTTPAGLKYTKEPDRYPI